MKRSILLLTLLSIFTLFGCKGKEAEPARFASPVPAAAAQGSLFTYNDASYPVLLPPGDAGQPLATGGANANLYYSTIAGTLAPPATVTVPPSIPGAVDAGTDAGGTGDWAWVNQQGSSFSNITIGLVLTTTYQATQQPGCLVHPKTGSSTMSVAASHVWSSVSPTATSLMQVGYGVCMYNSASGDWAIFAFFAQQDANSPWMYFSPLLIYAAGGASFSSATKVYFTAAMRPAPFTVERMRMTGTSSSSPVALELSEDGATFSEVGSATLSTLFGGSSPDSVGYGYIIPTSSAMTGNFNATYYNEVETN